MEHKRVTLFAGHYGSGKTNIYIELTKRQLNSDKSVILLVPEIALTSQLVQNLGEVVLLVVGDINGVYLVHDFAKVDIIWVNFPLWTGTI